MSCKFVTMLAWNVKIRQPRRLTQALNGNSVWILHQNVTTMKISSSAVKKEAGKMTKETKEHSWSDNGWPIRLLSDVAFDIIQQMETSVYWAPVLSKLTLPSHPLCLWSHHPPPVTASGCHTHTHTDHTVSLFSLCECESRVGRKWCQAADCHCNQAQQQLNSLIINTASPRGGNNEWNLAKSDL